MDIHVSMCSDLSACESHFFLFMFHAAELFDTIQALADDTLFSLQPPEVAYHIDGQELVLGCSKRSGNHSQPIRYEQTITHGVLVAKLFKNMVVIISKYMTK